MSRANVYVVELAPSPPEAAICQREPGAGKECPYVGQIYLSPEKRFENHKRGYRASRWVRRYGSRLRQDVCADYGPMDSKLVEAKEKQLAHELSPGIRGLAAVRVRRPVCVLHHGLPVVDPRGRSMQE